MKKNIFLGILGISFLFLGCFSDNDTQVSLEEIVQPKKLHSWYQFDGKSFKNIDKITDYTDVISKPWTEAVRVSDSVMLAHKAYFLVNKIGIVGFDDTRQNPLVHSDSDVFSSKTAKKFFLINNTPYLFTYKNTFFNAHQHSDDNAFLYRFESDVGVFFSQLEKKIFELPEQTEIVDMFVVNGDYYFAFKRALPEKSYFYYKKMTNYIPSTNVQSFSATIEDIPQDEFISFSSPKSYDFLPSRIQKLLARFDKDISYFLVVHSALDGSKKTFSQLKNDTSDDLLNGEVFLTDTFSLAVFSDGTCFFEGALPKNYIVKNGEVLAFKLPKLPNNFSYTNIGVTTEKLYVGWEQRDFYKIQNAGFIEINLKELLYQ
ncbi:MAG: hypothetical protein E7062_10295 [Spirochaetaceae bacterium]|nr:hypothetical protein [Spirochaetaceae bacterium]